MEGKREDHRLEQFRTEHPYLELCDTGTNCIFFCMLCSIPCDDEHYVKDHLAGDLHRNRLALARLTLLKPNPWPFSDGYNFFTREERDSRGGAGEGPSLVIPRLWIKSVVTDLRVTLIGKGKIGVRFCEKGNGAAEVRRIWCEWLGNVSGSQAIHQHDFAIVTFSHSHDLGRWSPGVELSLSADRRLEVTNAEEGDDASRSLQHLAEERICEICQRKMLPGKDVAALLNTKTGKMACSSRHITRALFHVFHVSCLIHWLLLREMDIIEGLPLTSEIRSKRKKGDLEGVEYTKDGKLMILSAICPECMGTSWNIEGDGLQRPTFNSDHIDEFLMKLDSGLDQWMEDPEELENCSTGFHFPEHFGDVRVQVVPRLLSVQSVHCKELMRSQHRPFSDHLLCADDSAAEIGEFLQSC